MNPQSLAILAMAIPNLKTVAVKYITGPKVYTFLTDFDVMPGQFATVSAAPADGAAPDGKMWPSVVQIVRVDATPQLSFHDPERNYRWLVSTIDLDGSKAREEQVKAVADQLAAVEYITQQQAAMDRYLKILPEGTPARAMIERSRDVLMQQLAQVGSPRIS